MKNITNNFGQMVSGQYKLFVVDQGEQVVWEGDWQKNLILNQGMNAVAPGALPTHNVSFADATTIASMGIGTRYNSIPVGYSAGEGSGSVVGTTFTFISGSSGVGSLTGSGGNGYTSVVQAGDMLQFQDLSEVRVVSVTNTSASVTGSTSVARQPFTIFKTSQVGLQSAIHYVSLSNIYSQTGYCGTTFVNNVFQQKRTWDFAYETSSVVVTEVGVGWATNGSNFSGFTADATSVFSRILLNQTVSLSSGQKLRLIYQMNRTFTPYVTSSVSASIGDGLPMTASVGGSNPWPVAPATNTNAYYNIQSYDASYVGTDGDTVNPNGFLEPKNNVTLFWSENSSSLLSSGNSVNRVGSFDTVTGLPDSYTTNNFTVTKTGTFAASAGTSTLRSMGMTTFGVASPALQAFCILFNQPQTKTNVQTLAVTYQYSWGRTLS